MLPHKGHLVLYLVCQGIPRVAHAGDVLAHMGQASQCTWDVHMLLQGMHEWYVVAAKTRVARDDEDLQGRGCVWRRVDAPDICQLSIHRQPLLPHGLL